MIPEDFREDIIQNGINFMRCITEAYGSDEGMKLWDTIADTLDPDIKGQILFAMLTGRYHGQIRITRGDFNWNTAASIIDKIKAVRAASGMGLKDAKDAIDNLRDSNKPIQFDIPAESRTTVINTLRNVGLYL